MKVLIDIAVAPAALEKIRRLPGVSVVMTTDGAIESKRAQPIELIRDVDAVFCSFPPTNHREMTSLKWVQLGSSGYEQVLGQGFPERGVRVSNGSGIFDNSIAEWNVAMMVNLVRDLPQMYRNQLAGHWDREPARFQSSLRGKVVGFWSYGGLARDTARLCKAMGMQVHTLTRSGVSPRPLNYVTPGTGDPEGRLPDRDFNHAQKKEFLSGLDFLVLGTALNAQTRGMVGEEELRALPRHAFLINPARGPLVREDALVRALRERWFAGAALDAHFYYPTPPEHPLWKMPNVIMTPHISGSGAGEYYAPRVWDIFSRNLVRFERGEPLLNELTPAQLGSGAVADVH